MTRGRVTLLFANACFAFLRLPEKAFIDGHCWGLQPYIRLTDFLKRSTAMLEFWCIHTAYLEVHAPSPALRLDALLIP